MRETIKIYYSSALLLISLWLIQGTSSLQCYQCSFTTPNRGDAYCFTNDHNKYPPTAIQPLCHKCLHNTTRDGDTLSVARRCLRKGDPRSQDASGCKTTRKNDVTHTSCVCSTDLCNVHLKPTTPPSAGATIVRVCPFVIILAAALLPQIL